jgi:two-component sensor histidine kinase
MCALRERIIAINNSADHDLTRARARVDALSFYLKLDIIASILLGVALLAIVARARTRLLRDLADQNLLLEDRVKERTAALEARSRRIETLLQDMSHRVGNSLSLVTGFLDLQARASRTDEVKRALAAARQRVSSIASAQRRMRLAMDSDTVESESFFSALIDDLRQTVPDDRIAIRASIARVSLASQDASAFGVILNELLANALKHAWSPTDAGAVTVAFTQSESENILSVVDDGRGHDREDGAAGLGRILVESLVQSIDGALETGPVSADPDRPGLSCVVRAPI